MMDRREFLATAGVIPLALIPLSIDLEMEPPCNKENRGECCRYFGEDERGPSCGKLIADERKIIDRVVADYLSYTNGNNELNLPIGDNCEGRVL